MGLKGETIKIDDVSASDKRDMYAIMGSYFDGMSWEVFDRDFCEKQWVIVLRHDTSDKIAGFSTQMVMEAYVDGERYKAFFSGDTIVDKNYWCGDTQLITAWLDLALSLAESFSPVKLYWFLISKGYRTYRFLPMIFKDYCPRYDRETPAREKKILDIFASKKYPFEYDSLSGLIKPRKKSCLNPEMAKVREHRLTNPHVTFFLKKNPGYENGDELACLAEISKENLTATAGRFLRQERARLIKGI